MYGELPDAEHKRIAEKLFKSLTEKVDANRGIRRPMQLAELLEICGGKESHLREVRDAFRLADFLAPLTRRFFIGHSVPSSLAIQASPIRASPTSSGPSSSRLLHVFDPCGSEHSCGFAAPAPEVRADAVGPGSNRRP